MRFTLISVAAIAPVALASPQGYGYGHEQHGRHHRPHHRPSGFPGSPSGGLPTGGASASGAASAPYGFGNSTAGADSTGFATGTQVLSTTVHQTVVTTLPAPSSTLGNGPDSGSSVPSGTSITANEAAGGSAGTCNSETVTKTFNPTYTVTVTGSQAAPVQSTFATPVSASGISPASLSSNNESTTASVPASTPSTSTETPSSPAPVPESTEAPETTTSAVQSTEVPASSKPVSQSKAPMSVPAPSKPAKDTTTAAPTPTPSSTSSTSSVAVAPTTASSSTPAAYPVPSSKSAAGGKRGILASGPDQDALVSAFDNSSKITWLANWYSAPPPNLGSHIEFVPQDYGKESNVAPNYEWTTNAKQAIAKGAKYFLGFGEPEAPDTPTMHTQMDPQDAVTLYMSDLQPYAKQGIKIGAPAVLQPDPDIQWLKTFLGLCETAGCDISFIAIHWVWSATPAERVQDFKDTVNNATALANGKPVWVDNFQASGTNEEQQQWLSQVLPWLESNDAVERYAYVSPSRSTGTGFLNADGSMSSLGEYYANF